MDLSKICMNCFKLKNDSTVCPYCGQVGVPSPKEAYYLMPGTILSGRYLIGKTLDAGGFGVVYKTLDLKLGRIVAVKEFFPASLVCRTPGETKISIYSGDKEAEYRKGLARFLEEARNMADFAREPHIVNVFDFFEENRTAYIVMEYLNGLSLDKYILQKSGRLSVEETIEIIKPVLSGLKVLHERSIVHRDINPKNIFITADNRVKIIDFGTAKFCDENERTRTNIVSDGYAPPEQYKTRSVEGAYTDIYAIGATMYKAITGKVPTQALERAMEGDTMPTPKALVPEVPENIDIAIMKAMAVKTKLRFQSVEEMSNALVSQDPKIDYPEKEEKKRVFRRNTIVISALVAVIVTLVTVLLLTQKKDEFFKAVSADMNKTEVIYAYVPYESEDELEDLEIIYTALSEDFYAYSKKYLGKKVTVEPVFVEEDSYEAEINSNIDSDKAVCVFRNDISDSLDIGRESLELIADELGDDTYFVDTYKDFYGPEYLSVPLSFSIYLQYSNKAEKLGMDGITSWNQFEDKDSSFSKYTVSEDAICGLYVSLKNSGASQDTAKKVFGRAVKNGKIADHNATLSAFTNKQTFFYAGTTEDLGEIKESDINMSYELSNLYGNQDEWYGKFTQEWSVSSDASESQISASILFLRYCLSERGQKILFVDKATDKVHLSLNKNLLGSQKTFVSKLNELNLDNLLENEKIKLYSVDSDERKFERNFLANTEDADLFIENNY